MYVVHPVVGKTKYGNDCKCHSVKSCLACGKEYVNYELGKNHFGPYVPLWHQTAWVKEIIKKSCGFQSTAIQLHSPAAFIHCMACWAHSML